LLRRFLAVLLTLALPAGQAAGSPPAPPIEVANIPVGLLIDFNSGRTLYAREPSRRFLPASTAKVMTAYVAFQEIKKGRLPANHRFTVREATARQWNGRGTSLYLKGGATLDTDTLLQGIATISANDAAVVLAAGYAGNVPTWCAMMNAAAHRLGMADSHFDTPNGWPDGGATYVNAQDLVTLGQALITENPEFYHRYFGQKQMTWDGVTQVSHDPTIGIVRGADGIKTGHTNEAGYNFLSSAERNGRRLITVVAGAHSEAERAAASRALLERGFSEWQARPLFAPGKEIAKARVQEGNARSVPLVTDRAVAAVLPKGERGTIALRVSYLGPLMAPIAKGTRVAELEIRAGEGPPSRLPLYAGAAVSKASSLDRLVNSTVELLS
jgi:D-alanyl-D-alanine carboxypeptidase (penicillin-binding protein 5/6)